MKPLTKESIAWAIKYIDRFPFMHSNAMGGSPASIIKRLMERVELRWEGPIDNPPAYPHTAIYLTDGAASRRECLENGELDG